MAYRNDAGDVIALDNPKAGALVMSTSLEQFGKVSTDPVRLYARRDAFRTVAEAIASNAASVPFNLYERDEANGRRKLRADEDPVAAALEQPHATITPFRWVESLFLDLVLHDRWVVFIDRLPDGRLEFLRIPANWCKFAVDGFRRITHVVVTDAKGRTFPIPAEECLFDVGYDPSPAGKFTAGFSIANTLEASAAELERGAAWRAKVLEGGPRVPMYIKRPADAPAWDRAGGRDRFVSSFREYSAEKAGQVPLLEDGMELAAVPEMPIKDVEYAATRKAAQIEFAIAMHFPPELVGYREGNFSNIEALREQLYIDTLGSKITAFRQAINAGLRRAGLVEVGKRYVEENLGVRLASAPEKQAKVLQTQVGAPIRTVNEARAMQNLPPVEGGDELIVPLNVTRGGLASPTDTGPKSLGHLDVFSRKALEHPAGGSKAALSIMRDRFQADLANAFSRQAARVKSALGTAQVAGPLDKAFDLATENAELASVILPHSYALAVAGAEAVLSRYNPKSEGFDPELMLPWLRKAADGLAGRINSTTYARLAEKLYSSEEWSADVDALFSRLEDGRASVYAKSVTTTSTSFGGQDAAKASGLDRKTWRHSGSADSHSGHAEIDGETVPFDDLFSNGLRWPGDPGGKSQETGPCGCHVEFSKASE